MVTLTKIKNRFLEFYQRHEVLVSLIVFAAGFAVDVYTIRRIDNPRGLIQQAVYLLLLGALLVFEIRKLSGLSIPRRVLAHWRYHNLVVHFLFGSLLSLYTIFYYTSASTLTSFIFILLLMGLLFANEFGKIRSVGLPVRSILYSMCTLSYFSFLYPILLGRMGPAPFWLGFFSSFGLIAFIWLLNFRSVRRLKKEVLYPVVLIHAFFLTGYYTSFLPPVPVAVKKIGVYYAVEKKEKRYLGLYLPHPWKFWSKGSQEFHARPGDKVTVLLAIFSPTRFQDQIFLKWYHKDQNRGWVLEDSIPMTILGGRPDGFRGFGTKQFYSFGDWKVLVETSDGREVGSIRLSIAEDLTLSPRNFLRDSY